MPFDIYWGANYILLKRLWGYWGGNSIPETHFGGYWGHNCITEVCYWGSNYTTDAPFWGNWGGNVGLPGIRAGKKCYFLHGQETRMSSIDTPSRIVNYRNGVEVRKSLSVYARCSFLSNKFKVGIFLYCSCRGDYVLKCREDIHSLPDFQWNCERECPLSSLPLWVGQESQLSRGKVLLSHFFKCNIRDANI